MFYDKRSDEIRWGSVIGTAFVVIVALILFFSSIFTVGAGQVGIVTQWGAVVYTVGPGLGFKNPFGTGIVKMDIRTQKDQVDASAASKDLQVVTSKIAVNYHLDPNFALDVFSKVGTDYAEKAISPSIQNTFKGVTAQFTAEELITKREEVRIKSEKALSEQLAIYHVIVENFNIVNFDFSPEFNAAIEQKQVAQQQVETAKQKLAQAQVDAETAITVAKGQAQSQAAVRDAGALSPAYLQYLFLQKWNGIMPTVIGGATPVLDINQFLPANTAPTGK